MPPDYFANMYAADADPWKFQSRWYEQRKYALTMAALPRRRYRSAFEPGCSIGVLSELLADRCDQLLCCDAAEVPAAAATARLKDRSHVTVQRRLLPAEWPTERFDLVVLSELLYYFGDADLAAILDRTMASLEPAGTVVVAHWLHDVPEYPQRGRDVQAAVRKLDGLALVAEHSEADFLLDVYVRDDGASGTHSVAADEGLV